jgi:hypothetical protein
LASSCNKKCIAGYHDGELNVAELACVDRCSLKYLQAYDKVGHVLHEFEKQMNPQQQGGGGPGR